jgi:hypothetical protein
MIMKNILYAFIAALLFLTYGCKRDLTSKGVSSVTDYVVFNLTGGSQVSIARGKAFVDPGYKGTEGTKDMTSSVKVTGTVDGMKVGMYSLKYSAVNSDGFSSSTDRTVIIYDPAAPATDLTANYLAGVRRVAPAASYSGLKVSIKKMAPGFFYVSDFLGGFYAQGRNYLVLYGSGYELEGYMQLNADNTLTLISSHSSAWGDSLNKLTNGVYDPATQSLSWDAFYTTSNYDFKVTLEKVKN